MRPCRADAFGVLKALLLSQGWFGCLVAGQREAGPYGRAGAQSRD